jgi:hypothetical protein
VRVRAAVAAPVLAAAVLVAGCAASTAGTPSAAGPGAPSSAAAAAPDGPGTCRVELGSGSVSMRGGSGRVSTVNGVTTLTCGSGPPLLIADIGADAVEVSVQGGPNTTLRPGPATTVGAYTIAVDTVAGGRATIRVTPPPR